MTRETAPTPLAAPPFIEQRIQPHRLIRFELICRYLILTGISGTCALGWFVSNSLTWGLLQAGGEFGKVVLWVMTAGTALGWLDFLINDLAPARFSIEIIKRHRHFGFWMLGGTYLLQAYASLGCTIGIEDILPFIYMFTAGGCGWYAWVISNRGTHV